LHALSGSKNLDSAKKLKGNKTADLIILEKTVSIAKTSPAITKTVETEPSSSIKTHGTSTGKTE
jgi:hypothetical protein